MREANALRVETERTQRTSGIFETEDLDRLRWQALDRRIGEALSRVARCDRLGLDPSLRDAAIAMARIRVWCQNIASAAYLEDEVRSLLSRTYRWTAMIGDDLADIGEGPARAGRFPLGAYAELAASCFFEDMRAFDAVPLMVALRRDVRALVRAVRG